VFIGHFALALGAKRAVPAISLGTLFLACQLADILWPTFVLAGLERVDVDPGNTAFTPLNFISYPFSHSLVALVLWGAVLAAFYRTIGGSSGRAAVLLAFLVVSHWILDVITHRPDVPLSISGNAKVGLGLWNSVLGTILVEAVFLVVGLLLYLRQTRATDRVGSIGFWTLMATLVLIFIASAAGPPPPSSAAVVWSAEGLWLFVIWAHWVDKHRESTKY